MNVSDMDEQQLEDVLPPIIRHIRDVVGLAATLKIIEAFGGTHMRVPSKYSPECFLARLIGHDKAVDLIEHFANEVLYVMKADAILRVQRNRIIQDRFKAGTSAIHLAHDYGLSYRQIWTIIGADDRPGHDPQASLF